MANDPFEALPKVPSFELKSSVVADGELMKDGQFSAAFGVPFGKEISPDLQWSGEPEGTKSFAVTMYDPDAPTGAGFWHWAVADVPADVHELALGAGAAESDTLPAGAYQLFNDARANQYIGAAPAEGDAPHRYFITVYALDVDKIGIPVDSTVSFLGFNMSAHTLGRASIVALAKR